MQSYKNGVARICAFLIKDLQEQIKVISQERDELVSKVESFDKQLKAAAEEKKAIDKEFNDSKEEFQSVKNQLLELKENLQLEHKEKEVSLKFSRSFSFGIPC